MAQIESALGAMERPSDMPPRAPTDTREIPGRRFRVTQLPEAIFLQVQISLLRIS